MLTLWLVLLYCFLVKWNGNSIGNSMIQVIREMNTAFLHLQQIFFFFFKQCYACNCVFEANDTKHHCRSCGEGFCDECSSNKRPVPERGWGHAPVRVCDQCFVKGKFYCLMLLIVSTLYFFLELDNICRCLFCSPRFFILCQWSRKWKHSKACHWSFRNHSCKFHISHWLSSMSVPLKFFILKKPYFVFIAVLWLHESFCSTALLKDSIRPAYWVPDYKITNCCICNDEFGEKLILHHCRSCGRGVCDNCSPQRVPVPLRGWDHPVRVCKDCTPSWYHWFSTWH